MKRLVAPITRPRAWWRSLDDTTRKILYILAIAALITALPAAALSGDWTGLLLNLGTEFAGGMVTFILLDQVLGTSRRKRELIAQMGSSVNDETKRAVEELRRHGWLTDGTLKGADLYRANLAGANLRGVDLSGAKLGAAIFTGADMPFANLSGAILAGANFEGARLRRAILVDADCTGANFSEAKLEYASLEGARLPFAILAGAVLTDCNLMGANLAGAKLDGTNVEGATLPNGERWHPGYNMGLFTGDLFGGGNR